MKIKALLTTSVLFLQPITIGNVFAGGVENLHNFSAEYSRTLNRNASFDSLDAVAYNPAGTVLMADGSYINGSLQIINKDYDNVISGSSVASNNDTYSQDKGSLIPSLFLLNKKDQWSYYGAITVPSGGGEVLYKNGNATIQRANVLLGTGATAVTNASAEASSKGVGITIGTAYQFNEKLSLSFGIRHLTSDKASKLNFTTASGTVNVSADFDAEASGTASILGINYQVNEDINLAARYETATKLNYKFSINSGSNATGIALLAGQGITDGLKERFDLPALLALGASFKINPDLKMEVNVTRYFQKDADWAGDEDLVSNATDTGFALEYTVNNKFKASVGYLKTETGQAAKDTQAESPKLDGKSFATGIVYQYSDTTQLNIGYSRTSYDSDSYVDGTTGLTIAYDKSVSQLSMGINYKF